ncbi:MAG TPA: DUF2807 domain-containing protein, partial [Phnomibacter sp.]|nr:DUF2807 domain-containing protein [Phnomibacter sp.]
IIKSTEYKVEMTGYANLLDVFEATVQGGNLNFSYRGDLWVKNDNIKLKIYTPTVTKIHQSGVTKVVVGNGYDWDMLHAFLSGESHFEVTGGTANNFGVDGSGNSKIFARNLLAKSVEVFASGNTQAEVRATDYLYVDASGRTRVRYWGLPISFDIRTSGEARVIRQ